MCGEEHRGPATEGHKSQAEQLWGARGGGDCRIVSGWQQRITRGRKVIRWTAAGIPRVSAGPRQAVRGSKPGSENRYDQLDGRLRDVG